MREIRFRAWDVIYECMEQIIDLYWFEENGVHNSGGFGYFSDYYIMQYTGLKDKNGVEIYEGDIVKYKTSWSDLSFIVFEDGEFRYSPIVSKDFKEKIWNCRICGEFQYFEVVGNIYENPELIER